MDVLATLCYMGTRVTLDIDAIGRRALARREELHLEQSEVAEKAGMSRAYISRLENASVRNPKVVDLASVASALSISLDSLIYGRVDQPDADFAGILMRRFGPQVGGALVQLDRVLAQIESGDEAALSVLVANTAGKYEPAHNG
jgi:transcriptional regulator with XRE-family HTH domain